jgi:hypothetical protein
VLCDAQVFLNACGKWNKGLGCDGTYPLIGLNTNMLGQKAKGVHVGHELPPGLRRMGVEVYGWQPSPFNCSLGSCNVDMDEIYNLT